MAANPNRSTLYTKCHKVLKKHYKPVEAPELSVLDTLMYSFCLENSPHEKADQAFGQLKSTYFDWNEVRVTTVPLRRIRYSSNPYSLGVSSIAFPARRTRRVAGSSSRSAHRSF